MASDFLKEPTLLFSGPYQLKNLDSLAQKISHLLWGEKNGFCVFLSGHMGSGKTSFVRKTLYALGLNKALPVHSPTFSLVYEYEIDGRIFAHMDLYRPEAFHSEEELLATFDPQRYHGIFVEWPPETNFSLLAPSHLIQISSDVHHASTRFYEFFDLR